MPLIGYARVSTDGQHLPPQLPAVGAAGCEVIFEEHASGGNRTRPKLAEAMRRVGRGDTLLVARIDRLARSLSHLLDIVEALRAKGAHFRSLGDPIDTTGPSGVLVLQMLGAVAEFERSLIRERVKAGIAAAKARGRAGGSPGLRMRDPATIAALASSRRHGHLQRLVPHAEEWLAVVRRLRPARSWETVVEAVNAGLPSGRRRFTRDRLVRSVRALVREGMADPFVLEEAPRKRNVEGKRTIEIVAAFLSGKPTATLADIGNELTRMRVLPPRGGSSWAPSSVKSLVDRARASGMLICRQTK